VIVVACVVDDNDLFRAQGQPGVLRAAASGAEPWVYNLATTLARTYNLILERASAIDELEALVLVQRDTEILDEDFVARARDAIAVAGTGIIGAVGSTGVRSLAWWQGQVSAGTARLRYPDFEGGTTDAYDWASPSPAPQPADIVDGSLMVLSPDVVRTLRFDESFVFSFGPDVDFCLQATAAGHHLATADLAVEYHRGLDMIPENAVSAWLETHRRLAVKWEGRGDDADGSEWRQRARRAEAERDAARTFAQGLHMTADAQSAHLDAELRSIDTSRSWHLTEPLRAFNASRKRRRSGR